MNGLFEFIEWKRLVRSLALPMFFAVIAITFSIVLWIFDLPKGEQLILIVRGFFDRYGYITLFISAIFEGALIIGFYYPGAFVIFLSVILAGKDLARVASVVGIVSVAFAVGLSVDYFLGKYGWYKLFLRLGFGHEMNKAKNRLHKRGLGVIFLTYWDVNIASFTATAAGILRYPYFHFLVYSALAILIWNSFWAALVYFVGQKSIELVSGRVSYAITVIAIWSLFVLIKHIIENIKTMNVRSIK